MTGGRRRPARYQLTFHEDIEADLATLDSAALDAAQAILDDLAHGRVTGKALGIYRAAVARLSVKPRSDP